MFEKIALMAFNAFLWIIWAVTRYFYNLLADNEKNFSLWVFAFSMFVWMWVGVMIWDFISEDALFRDGVIIFAWIVSFEIVEASTKRAGAIADKVVDKYFKK